MTLTTEHVGSRQKLNDRQDTARRLLASSARKSYDPLIEVDWDAPVDHESFYGMTPEWCSLYGTGMWDQMTQEQRITLTEHEAASISATGIWFEIILMQMLIRDAYKQDPASPHFQFALTEIADECRHSTMFAKAAEHFGIPNYERPRWINFLSRPFKALASGSLAFGGTLAAEEILDMMQRDFMKDPRVQPVTRTVSKIHVLEEARHIRFAREETKRIAATMTPFRRAVTRLNLAIIVYMVVYCLVNPKVYEAAGLDRKQAVRAARANTHYNDRKRTGCAKTIEFLDECGLIGGPGTYLLRRGAIM
ncbi:AurF N-oxygenase family protein [Williamsia deligens]|uniref:Diiron oxygenase n=1 Tax=Williamsia deligens TaxID=321325 RepID=A0ABW3GB31_9NOCA|nr:diiron oxygenase [Williamsia deligens]MCP2193102.1 P-aminobenzoate N-oxygenase AurF [Williamsia deligens]